MYPLEMTFFCYQILVDLLYSGLMFQGLFTFCGEHIFSSQISKSKNQEVFVASFLGNTVPSPCWMCITYQDNSFHVHSSLSSTIQRLFLSFLGNKRELHVNWFFAVWMPELLITCPWAILSSRPRPVFRYFCLLFTLLCITACFLFLSFFFE